MALEKHIRQIIERLMPDNQTLLWTAEWRVEDQELAYSVCKDPITITTFKPDIEAMARVK
jgi:superfamily II DNA/RNA helicase